MGTEQYRLLAQRLDSLPNGYPPTDDGVELRLLAKLFKPEEAELASQLRLTLETPERIAERLGRNGSETKQMLRSMAKRGLIKAGRTEDGLGYGLLPFVVGIYEYQAGNLDKEMAQLFENYFMKAFGQGVSVRPHFHRVLPVNETIRMDMEVQPYESAAGIIAESKAWGVTECICRKQKALIGEPCDHPLEVCMIMSKVPGVFDKNPQIRALSEDEALKTLQTAAEAGLVHTVSNNQKGNWYVCNCCTCSCGILRGISDFGVADVVARSSFVNRVDGDLCMACEICVDYCQFDALSHDEVAQVDEFRCVGCGVCVVACPEGALSLVLRPTSEISPPPITEDDWLEERALSRGLNLKDVI
ncbi:MAG: 4Fe-4S ferredoxin [Anaerolineales bacterium]|nr:4Fe-4S ferredoxin [Anaerolineales bacterium]